MAAAERRRQAARLGGAVPRSAAMPTTMATPAEAAGWVGTRTCSGWAWRGARGRMAAAAGVFTRTVSALIFTCRFKSACLAAMKFIFLYFVNFYSVLYQNGLREQPFHQKEHGNPAQISRVLKASLIDREPGSSILRRTCVTRFHRKTVRSVHSMSTCILK